MNKQPTSPVADDDHRAGSAELTGEPRLPVAPVDPPVLPGDVVLLLLLPQAARPRAAAATTAATFVA